MRYLDLDLMKNVCHVYAVTYLNKDDDPISPFETSNYGLMDSALNLHRQTFDGVDLYKTLEEKAAVLWYALVKNHAFQNGNKRIATISLIVFLGINGYWIDVSNEELAGWTIKIAESSNKENTLNDIRQWLKVNLKIKS